MKHYDFVTANANFSSNWVYLLSLFDWSETGVSDEVGNITATQLVESKIKAYNVSI